MEINTILLIIAFSSCSSIILLCGCFRFYINTYTLKDNNRRLYNIRKKIISSQRIKPIPLTIIDEEIKCKSEIRLAEENV